MDSFTENILARARERQKMLKEYSDKDNVTPLREANSESNLKSSQSTLGASKIGKKETASDSQLSQQLYKNENFKENRSDDNLNKFVRQTSKTRISSDMPGSPNPQLKTLNIQNGDINMEIKVTSSDNVRLEVEIQERDSDNDSGSVTTGIGLRKDAKKRLDTLGQLYAGGDDADISSPIHRSEEKFHQQEENSSASNTKKQDSRCKRGLKKLADLASHINEWEDDLGHPKPKVSEPQSKKIWKPPAPQPPVQSSTGKVKGKAPQPPKVQTSPQKSTTPTISSTKPNSGTQVVGVTPKQLKWDQAVLDTLESQGFTRTASTSRLVYTFNNDSQEHGQSKNETSSAKVEKMAPVPQPEKNKINEEDKNIVTNDKPEVKGTSTKVAELQANFGSKVTTTVPKPKTPVKLGGGSVAGRAAMFESGVVASTPPSTVKDPALMSVSERKALFEKNKGTALVPKAAFGMSAPIEAKNTPKTHANNGSKPEDKANLTNKVKYPAPASPSVHNTPVSATVHQSDGIASKMAQLLENKSTISEAQISSNVKEQRQKEIDQLLNRFNKNKVEQPSAPPAETETDSDEDEVTEDTAMLCNNRSTKVISSVPPPPPPLKPEVVVVEGRRSSGKRSSTSSDSHLVTSVLDEVKRIKVSPPKAGKLYPNLSDIEASTETEAQTQSDDSSNSSFGEQYDSDEPNTSFGRDILKAVCKNQTPHKRPIYDDSTASDISSVLDGGLDEIPEEESECTDGPTPPKHYRQSGNAQYAAPSHSFNYKNFTPNNIKSPMSQFKSPLKVPSPRKSLENPTTFVMEGDNVLPLTHSVSFYRKQQSQTNKTPVKKVTRQPLLSETTIDNINNESAELEKKIKQLEDEVNKQQMIISQTSQALNLCNCTPEFSGSTEQVEAERVLLVATHRRQAALHEIQRMRVEGTIRPQGEHSQHLPLEKGTLTISKIVLPLKQKYVTALAATGGKGHHVVCLIKCGDQVVPTKLVSTTASDKKNPDVDLCIPGSITLNNIYSDFTVTFEVYSLQAQEEFLPHEVKYHINKKSSKITPKKKQDSRLQRPVKESPAGPQAVRSSSFALMGYVVFSVQAVSKRHWSLNNCPSMSPLEGNVEMKISCELALSVEHRGFLTMFEDVSGFGAWHRRWCLLSGHTLSYWKYPDDERKTAPIDSINLKTCVTRNVELVSRDICARMHTFLLERERMAYPQDKDTLVVMRKGDKTIIKHLLSADTKEERIEWCQKFNAALTAIRMWGNSEQ
ncbi:anillin isoform X2 [Aethina tumida]|uniref:anillin isoform X2 n=1 Tax=Aethina tumida TaxID=116153 RepID=UPI00214761AD|nr:anillin isoform X2 [Aethina tumida]